MNYALIIYTVVAMSGQNSSLSQAHDWRYITSFKTVKLCHDAVHEMGISAERYRCVKTTE